MAEKLPEPPAGSVCPHSIAAMTPIVPRHGAPARTRTDAVVVGVLAPATTADGPGRGKRAGDKSGRGSGGEGIPSLAPGAEPVGEAYGRRLRPLLAQLGVTGKRGETVTVPAPDGVGADVVVLVALGSEPADTAVRRAAGVAARALKNAASAALTLPAHTPSRV